MARRKGKDLYDGGPPRPLKWRPRVRIFGIITGAIGGLGTVVLVQQYGISPLSRGLTLQGFIGGALSGVVIPSAIHALVVIVHNRRLRAALGGAPTDGPGGLQRAAGAAALTFAVTSGFLIFNAKPAHAVLSGPCAATFNGVDVASLSLDTSGAMKVGRDDVFNSVMSSAGDVTYVKLGVRYAGFELTVIEGADEGDGSDSGGGEVALDFPVNDLAWLGGGLYEFFGTATLESGGTCTGSFLFDVDVDPIGTVVGTTAAGATGVGAAGAGVMTFGGLLDGRRTMRGLREALDMFRGDFGTGSAAGAPPVPPTGDAGGFAQAPAGSDAAISDAPAPDAPVGSTAEPVASAPDVPVGGAAEPVGTTTDAPVGDAAEPVASTFDVPVGDGTEVKPDDAGAFGDGSLDTDRTATIKPDHAEAFGDGPLDTDRTATIKPDDAGAFGDGPVDTDRTATGVGSVSEETFVDSSEVVGDQGATADPVDASRGGPGTSSTSGAPGTPTAPSAPGAPSVPGQPQASGQASPRLPGDPALPGKPALPGLPQQPGLPGTPGMPDLPTDGLPDLPPDGSPELPTDGVPRLPDPGVELPADPASATSPAGGWKPIHGLPLAAAGATAAGAAIKGRMAGDDAPASPVSDEAAQRAIEETYRERSARRAELADQQFFGQQADWQFTLGRHTLHLQPSTGRWHVLADGQWVDTGHQAGTVTFGVVDGQLAARPVKEG